MQLTGIYVNLLFHSCRISAHQKCKSRNDILLQVHLRVFGNFHFYNVESLNEVLKSLNEDRNFCV